MSWSDGPSVSHISVCPSYFRLSVTFKIYIFLLLYGEKKLFLKGNTECKKGGKKVVDSKETRPDTRLRKSRAGNMGSDKQGRIHGYPSLVRVGRGRI